MWNCGPFHSALLTCYVYLKAFSFPLSLFISVSLGNLFKFAFIRPARAVLQANRNICKLKPQTPLYS